MSKKRVIDRKIRSSQNFASLTFQQRDLWHGLIAVVDDQGRIPGTPAYVRSQVWPYDDLSLDDVAHDLNRLAEDGYIVIYNVDGSCYVQIINWWKYQAMQWAGKSSFPPPENWEDRYRYHGPENKIQKKNWERPGGFKNHPPSNKGSQQPSVQPSRLSEDKPTPREKDEVNDEVKLTKGAGAPLPVNLDGWLIEVKESNNRNATLMFMFNTLYPNATECPDYGYLGKTANVVGGAGRMAALMWECSSKKITGDVMRYIQAYSKNSNHQEEESKVDMEKQREEDAKSTRERIEKGRKVKE